MQLLERGGSRISPREGSGDKYKVRLMGWEPGAEYVEGSSAIYPVAAIKRDAPAAFPEGTRMRANHDGICEAGGDIRRIIARTTDTPWAEADGMYTNIRVSEEWSPWVKEYGDIVGLSISAAGELQMAENEDGDMEVVRDEATGLPYLKSFLSAEESPYNSIDFVEAPGADGRIVMALESARKQLAEMNIREQAKFASGIQTEAEKTSKATPPRSSKKGNTMEKEEREALTSEITESVTKSVLEALRPAQPKEDEPKLSATVEAVVAAGLSDEGRQDVYERIDRGVPVAEAVASVKTLEAAIEQRVAARFGESVAKSSAAGFGFTVDEAEGGTTVPQAKVDEAFDQIGVL